MKKIFYLMACVAIAFCCTSCYQSVVTPLGDGYASFTAKVDGTELLGVKVQETETVVVEPCYEVVYYKNGVFLAAQNNKWQIFDTSGQVLCKKITISNVFAGKGHFILTSTAGQKYLFDVGTAKLCGPAQAFTYYPILKVAFAQVGEKFGLYDVSTAEYLVQPEYDQVIYAKDQKGKTAYYAVQGKSVKRITADRPVTIGPKTLAAMKAEADKLKTPWPKKGCAVINLKTIR